MNIGSPSVDTTCGNSGNLGPAITETASIAYDGALLPAGTAKYGSELATTNLGQAYLATVDGNIVTASSSNIASNARIGANTISCNIGDVFRYTFNVSSLSTNGWGCITTGATYTGNIAIGGVYQSELLVDVLVTATATTMYLDIRPDRVDGNGSVTVTNVSIKKVLINPNTRYLNDLGKDKNHVLVESGQGKFFNGINQYINTGIIPNQAEGTLITRFTYASGNDKLVIGQSGGTANFMVGVNTSGKLYVRLGAASNIATSWSPIAGKSYHLAIRYIGGVAELIVDTVSIGTFTIDASIPIVALSIGARNTSTTASLFWNSVIDETYYYDVALTDAQISTLYQYPEKIKAYNGAIVPDIGYEDNCKLFLPLCENSGSNVVNVAIAKQDESYYNGIVQMSTSDAGAGGEVSAFTSLGSGAWNLKVTTIGTNIGSPYLTVMGTRPLETVSKTIDIEFDAVVTSGSCYITKFYNGTLQIALNTPYLIKNGHNILTVQTRASNSAVAYLYLDGTKLFDVSISNITSKASVSYPLASYTTAMHTSAAKLSYGAQCTAWKRDSLGVLLGMSNGLSFDGGVSVKPINTLWTPLPSKDFAIESIMYINQSTILSQGDGVNATGRLQFGVDSVGEVEILAGGSFRKVGLSIGYHHVAMKYNSVAKTWDAWADGVQFATNINASAYGIPTMPYSIGGVTTTTSWNNKRTTIVATPKIHKGTQYAKFNIDKSWKAAQKIIAKLGA